ncbi:alpha/beta-hydrolase [Aspergillus aculeatinus CBS 121060]|uniref:Alpha/beta-hydrolase n=1 Tax=Aspergillus aculeatinus CBS 121060 TaxID=1448322 RepID=A0ACD1H961_9EURO|nr:alpha/beta-hydrolase [Aspergillus aculeatinus CBS 121060]RAH70136.1 alpha/beta-hydrolase [Aspergillus aculeatinus CBS 121060]
MKRLLKLVKNHPTSTASTLRASAAPPTSGTASIDNLQGASAAAAELSDVLGASLKDIDLEDNLSAQARALATRLDDEASRYDNAQLSPEQCDEKWTCSQDQSLLLSLAWDCANESYNSTSPRLPRTIKDCVLTHDHEVTPSINGTVKAATFTTVDLQEISNGNELLPVLVIAIRGTASTVDHIVNINSKPHDASHFIVSQWFCLHSRRKLEAHSGFLHSAMALEAIVSERIKAYSRLHADTGSHILFTGHSAGGAVASLLFLHYISEAISKNARRFSCVTFGAPPVVTLPLMDGIRHRRLPKNLCLNLINEFDLVTRADKNYVLSLVNLLRSRNDPSLVVADAAAGCEQASGSFSDNAEGCWPLPRSLYSHVGPRIILFMRLGSSQEHLPRLCAVSVSLKEFDRLLFCRLSVHKRKYYAQTVGQLVAGQANGMIEEA